MLSHLLESIDRALVHSALVEQHNPEFFYPTLTSTARQDKLTKVSSGGFLASMTCMGGSRKMVSVFRHNESLWCKLSEGTGEIKDAPSRRLFFTITSSSFLYWISVSPT